MSLKTHKASDQDSTHPSRKGPTVGWAGWKGVTLATAPQSGPSTEMYPGLPVGYHSAKMSYISSRRV